MKILYALVILLLLPGGFVTGKNPHYFLQVGVGPQSYCGDLGAPFSKWSINTNVGLLFNRKKRLNGSVQFAFGNVIGQTDARGVTDPADATPNTYFKTNLFTLTYELQYNIVRNEHWKFYVAQGFGIAFFTPKDQSGHNLADQPVTRADGESYGPVTLMLPTKLGAIYFLPNDYGLGFETGFYNMLTDYIDNVSDWGDRNGFDNIWHFKFSLNIPVGSR